LTVFPPNFLPFSAFLAFEQLLVSEYSKNTCKKHEYRVAIKYLIFSGASNFIRTVPLPFKLGSKLENL
jgi:hypothetical protein